MATSKSGKSTSKNTGTDEPTQAPTAELTEAQERADAERREWEQRMTEEAREAEQQRDSAPRS